VFNEKNRSDFSLGEGHFAFVEISMGCKQRRMDRMNKIMGSELRFFNRINIFAKAYSFFVKTTPLAHCFFFSLSEDSDSCRQLNTSEKTTDPTH
jgi:hypothetical protein